MGALRILISASSAERLAAAAEAVHQATPGARVLIVGASRGAADDLARVVALSRPATLGVERLSLAQLALRAALPTLAERGLAPTSTLGADAVAARAAFDTARGGRLTYFGPVADLPGFPRALARTLDDVRGGDVPLDRLAGLAPSGADLAAYVAAADSCARDTSSVDRHELCSIAAEAIRREPVADHVVFLDVSVEREAEAALMAAVVAGASFALATVPAGDDTSLPRFVTMGGVVDDGGREPGETDLSRIRLHLFDAEAAPAPRDSDGSFQFFSAPGEGREAVEVARRVVAEARKGVRFDEMAIFVRSPERYAGLLDHALARAHVPVWRDRGASRPHPAGRAFLALLACAAERLSAARFAEYLSLGQVPAVSGQPAAWVAPDDETLRVGNLASVDGGDDEATVSETTEVADAIGAGTLRAPWRWERLLADAAVIGRDAARWRRRLDGREAELRRQLRDLRDRDGNDSPKVVSLARTLEQLGHLRTFAVPIVERLAAWPASATWGAWLDALAALAPDVLRRPSHVLRVLADLRPMAEVGPIGLDEVRRVLAERLLTVEAEPPARRFGRVFVGTPQQARGRSFRVVYVPGLAERAFPQKPREDPLLLDGLREQLDGRLRTQLQRLQSERRLLQLAAGAATERLYVSYPRIDLAEGRPRVPSFYAMDLVRAVTGRVPDPDWLEARASAAGNVTLAWPAPADPAAAIDEQEHDLAVLRRLLDVSTPGEVRGHAHYLVRLSEPLRRSVVSRWAHGERRWSIHDGTVAVTPQTAAALAARRLTARSYSPSALQRFAACPYQFVLSAFYRLQPLEQPESLQRMDPLTRGSLFHEIQAALLGRLRSADALPVTRANLSDARRVLDEVIETTTARAHDDLVPAVERVWDDEVVAIRRDLHGWLDHLADAGAEWTPRYFEWAFGAGSVPGERDPASVMEDAVVAGSFRLRGAVDLIEEHRETGVLRVTDHKTGRRPDRIDRVVTGGGSVLQPVLYPMAVEAGLGRAVSQGRLFYCTSVGGFAEHPVPLTERTRAAGHEVLAVIDRAVETGMLAAAPTDQACAWCDFRSVCGPDVTRRVRRKPQERLADLAALRTQP